MMDDDKIENHKNKNKDKHRNNHKDNMKTSTKTTTQTTTKATQRQQQKQFTDNHKDNKRQYNFYGLLGIGLPYAEISYWLMVFMAQPSTSVSEEKKISI